MKKNNKWSGRFVSTKGGGFHRGMAVFFLCAAILFNLNQTASAQGGPVRVELQTNLGEITLELDRQKAPITVANFLSYVESGFFDGTVFHRVIKGFMIQGGGFSAEMQKKQTSGPIKNEADNGLRNRRGTIAMARTSDPHSATGQFFINMVDNGFLDHAGKTSRPSTISFTLTSSTPGRC